MASGRRGLWTCGLVAAPADEKAERYSPPLKVSRIKAAVIVAPPGRPGKHRKPARPAGLERRAPAQCTSQGDIVPPEEFVMELCKPLHVRTAERLPHGLKLPGNAGLDGFRERRSL